MIDLLKWSVRLAGLGALLVGVLLRWGGFPATLRLHMVLGAVVAVYLIILALAAAIARVQIPMAAVSLLWAVATLYVGAAQTGLMPGSSHWVIEAVHVVLGIGAIGLVEMLAGAVTRQRRLLR